jgi:hypothetical protein
MFLEYIKMYSLFRVLHGILTPTPHQFPRFEDNFNSVAELNPKLKLSYSELSQVPGQD